MHKNRANNNEQNNKHNNNLHGTRLNHKDNNTYTIIIICIIICIIIRTFRKAEKSEKYFKKKQKNI